MVIVKFFRGSKPSGMTGDNPGVDPGDNPNSRHGSVTDGKNAIKKLIIQGHAGFAARGTDIVCAAASATAYTAAGALGELCGVPKSCVTERDGFFELTIPQFNDSETAYRADIIMEATYIGFKQIEASYPKYLTVMDN